MPSRPPAPPAPPGRRSATPSASPAKPHNNAGATHDPAPNELDDAPAVEDLIGDNRPWPSSRTAARLPTRQHERGDTQGLTTAQASAAPRPPTSVYENTGLRVLYGIAGMCTERFSSETDR